MKDSKEFLFRWEALLTMVLSPLMVEKFKADLEDLEVSGICSSYDEGFSAGTEWAQKKTENNDA